MGRMHEHFTQIAASYNELRTTDLEPIRYIQEKLQGRTSLRAADIGCGGGRYDLHLLQSLPGLHLTCVDINEAMLEETARFLKSHGQDNFDLLRADGRELRLADKSLDCILTFNTIHHLDPLVFLNQATRALRDQGQIFVYTRLRRQNARSIWGRFFPRFTEKEDRLYKLAQVEEWSDVLDALNLETIEFFRFNRTATLAQLVKQAENKHYSTFYLYSVEELAEAIGGFQRQIEQHFTDPERINWHDENVMMVFQKS